VNTWDNHPVVLEAHLQWKDLSEEEQTRFIEGLKIQNLNEFIQGCDVVIPSLFMVHFPANSVDPNAPPGAMGQVRVFVEPRVQTPATVEK
jgi:hypothetical protein